MRHCKDLVLQKRAIDTKSREIILFLRLLVSHLALQNDDIRISKSEFGTKHYELSRFDAIKFDAIKSVFVS